MGALKGPLVFAGILFFFSHPVFGEESTGWPYPTGEYPVETGYGDSCSACCKEKMVDGKTYYLVDYQEPPPPGCTSGCIYQEAYTGQRVCFGPGDYLPECLAIQNSTQQRPAPSSHVTATSISDDGCIAIRTGPYGYTRDVSEFFTDEPRALEGGIVQNIDKIHIQSGFWLDGFEATYTPSNNGDYHGGHLGSSSSDVILFGDNITCVSGQYGRFNNLGTEVNFINNIVLEASGGVDFGPFGTQNIGFDYQFKQCAPCEGGYLWYFSGYNSTYNVNGQIVTYIDQLFLHWRCCDICGGSGENAGKL